MDEAFTLKALAINHSVFNCHTLCCARYCTFDKVTLDKVTLNKVTLNKVTFNKIAEVIALIFTHPQQCRGKFSLGELLPVKTLLLAGAKTVRRIGIDPQHITPCWRSDLIIMITQAARKLANTLHLLKPSSFEYGQECIE